MIMNSLQDTRSETISTLDNAIITSQPMSGGLWAITQFPEISKEKIGAFVWMSYQELANEVLWEFDFGISDKELKEVIDEAYGKQWHKNDITPVKQIWNTNLFSLHLWYWPTLAFKNVALEFLPRLLTRLRKWVTINVLGASSWDTINAAHSWVNGTNINSIFMLPNSGPSEVQRLQAVNDIVNNPNAFTLLADKPFDPLQDIVKKINWPEYEDFKRKYNITSFNSINIARILAQVVYYFRAYTKLLERKTIENGEKIIFSVPSWNFWDALAWYYAKKIWLPIDKILVATNENDMLNKFFETGVYEPPKKDWKDFVWVTNAPSMDIAKSSNFERMLFDIFQFDYKRVKSLYDDLNNTGRFKVEKEILREIKDTFISSSCTDEERLNVIRDFWASYKHWMDPHSAAWVVPWVRWDYSLKWVIPVVFLETSHVAQFGAELREKWIDVPWMNEFDEFFSKIKNNKPVEWKNF